MAQVFYYFIGKLGFPLRIDPHFRSPGKRITKDQESCIDFIEGIQPGKIGKRLDYQQQEWDDQDVAGSCQIQRNRIPENSEYLNESDFFDQYQMQVINDEDQPDKIEKYDPEKELTQQRYDYFFCHIQESQNYMFYIYVGILIYFCFRKE